MDIWWKIGSLADSIIDIGDIVESVTNISH